MADMQRDREKGEEPAVANAAAYANAVTTNMIEIMKHTRDRAARGMYCGGGPDMTKLVEMGFMKSQGKVSWCPDEYFSLTPAGREFMKDKEL